MKSHSTATPTTNNAGIVISSDANRSSPRWAEIE
jgi:hypothetical protein